MFQRREDGSVDFFRDWDDYQFGFGTPTGEHWLGLLPVCLMSVKSFHRKLERQIKACLKTKLKTRHMRFVRFNRYAFIHHGALLLVCRNDSIMTYLLY